jgi:hypothetical protein
MCDHIVQEGFAPRAQAAAAKNDAQGHTGQQGQGQGQKGGQKK